MILLNTHLKKGWLVTFAGTGINLALGVLYTWSVFAAALSEQFHWTKTEAALPYTVACLVFALMMVPAGKLQDRYGPRLIATLGGVFAGGGLILSSFTESLNILILTFGLLTGAGIGLGYSAATPAAVKWFPAERKGLISGIVVAGFGLAAIYIAPLTHNLISNLTIKEAFRYEGFLFLLIIVILAQFLKIPVVSQTDQTNKSLSLTKKDYSWREMLKQNQFYLLWIMLGSGATAGLMIIGQLSSITKTQAGVSWGYAMVALLAVFNAGGRVLAGWLSDKIGRSFTMRLFFGLQAINMLMFSFYDTPFLIALGASLAGLGYGSLLSLFPSATYDYFGTKNGGVNYGLVFTAWGLGGVVGPIMAGRIVDLTQTYQIAYLIAALLCLISVGLTFILEKPAIKKNETSITNNA